MGKFSICFVSMIGIVGLMLVSSEVLGQRAGTIATGNKQRQKPRRANRIPVVDEPIFKPKGEIMPFGQLMPNDLESASDVSTFPVTVDPSLNLNANILAQYEQAANQINGYATVPNNRVNYYSSVIRDYTVFGWQGIVNNVTPNAFGNVVTLSVIPACGLPCWFMNDCTEQYLLLNTGGIQYLGSADPAGLAGQFPPEVDEY